MTAMRRAVPLVRPGLWGRWFSAGHHDPFVYCALDLLCTSMSIVPEMGSVNSAERR